MGMATLRREIAALDDLSRARPLTHQETWRLRKLSKVERRTIAAKLRGAQ